MTISQKLIDVNTAKTNIKAAIEAKGVDTTGVPFTNYHTKIAEIPTGGGETIPFIPDYDVWTRPTEWLTMPTVLPTDDDKIVMLVRINDVSYNEVMFNKQVNTGTYTVDWGDGTVEDIASAANAYHNYDYNNINLAPPLSDGTKQAIITVTPTTPGAVFTRVDFNTFAGRQSNSRTIPILEMIFNVDNPSTFLLGGYVSMKLDICERVEFVRYNRTLATFMFQYFYNLREVVIQPGAMTNLTNTNSMFSDCVSLKRVPNFDVSNVTYAGYMFNNCRSLIELPAFNFAAIGTLNMVSAFFGCASLVDLRHITIADPLNLQSTFLQCGSLRHLPTFTTTANATAMSGIFQECFSLERVEDTVDFSGCTSAPVGAFTNCYALKRVPNITVNTSGSMGSFFSTCKSLEEVGTLNFPNITNIDSIFSGCYAINEPYNTFNFPSLTSARSLFRDSGFTEVTLTSASNVTICDNLFYLSKSLTKATLNVNFVNVSNAGSMFRDCSALAEVVIPVFSTNGSASTSSMFSACYDLRRLVLGGMNQTFTIVNCSLGTDELNELFTSLGTVTAKTITVSGNPGAATCDTSIATAKGWTVVT